jgi:ubiquinone/menaquinone biosynthesis C-methylase UbiE
VEVISRKFNWVSSLDENNLNKLEKLQEELINFYNTSNSYYSEIDFTARYWNDVDQLLYKDIREEILISEKVLEVGCGASNCLLDGTINRNKYTGVDFSEKIIINNKKKYSEANFYGLTDPYTIPFKNETFDLVFSIFVIEHTVFPTKFLDECIRVLKKKGKIIILAPDFLGCSTLSSQRTGLSVGTGTEKLNRGKIFDALLTGYDNKIRIPLKMYFMRRVATRAPKFYINLTPTCFIDPFTPDVDAIYITYKNEMKDHLKDYIIWQKLTKKEKVFVKKHKLIYLKGTKVKN